MANIINELKQKIEGKGLKIVFPESNDERIVEAAIELNNEGLVKPILLGKQEHLPKGYDITGIELIDPATYQKMDEMIKSFVERRKGKNTEEQAKPMLLDENYFGTMLEYMGLANGLVSGNCHSIGELVTQLEIQ